MALASVRIRREYEPAAEMTAGCVHGRGTFVTNGTSDPAVQSSGPWTITRTGVGTLKVTGTEIFKESLGVECQLHGATANTQRAFVVSGTPTPGASPNTPWSFSIETQSTAGTAADLTGPVVVFDVFFRRGTLTK